MSAIVNNKILHYANTNTSYPSKNETTQELKNPSPKSRYAKVTYHGGTVSKYIKIFQRHINQAKTTKSFSVK